MTKPLRARALPDPPSPGERSALSELGLDSLFDVYRGPIYLMHRNLGAQPLYRCERNLKSCFVLPGRLLANANANVVETD